ncbi:hypothetical protein H113_07318 [Trichophyton rubrum MR1459]|uniref:Uncharacterized protein n=1 Tax=Trichophyton rubrum (strain ATCC MYA-4607 / CBS 118892) TaxID=559305 RepID=A0A080WRU0_TRIRC|nr:uncharacterized protein TERG_11864 [Trichophyton rubrum CBS 118892]EZF91829.1 hypothetical protein H113_07318 [Trichophyton rubrum MR1459]EZG02732.1 hypothetical protein H106_07103 [Trichophyton rubrum CBS 735.88]KFL60908.1 hypothetical protein TERG_11864 [Trichophyton rubrum CBS 118892]
METEGPSIGCQRGKRNHPFHMYGKILSQTSARCRPYTPGVPFPPWGLHLGTAGIWPPRTGMSAEAESLQNYPTAYYPIQAESLLHQWPQTGRSPYPGPAPAPEKWLCAHQVRARHLIPDHTGQPKAHQ